MALIYGLIKERRNNFTVNEILGKLFGASDLLIYPKTGVFKMNAQPLLATARC